MMHQLSNAPESSEKLTVCFNHEPLQHENVRCGSKCSLQEMVDLMLKDLSMVLENNSEEILLQRSPYTVDAITGEVRWLECKIDDWNVETDLAKYVAGASAVPIGGVAGYRVKSAIFHIHDEDSPVTMTSGHYVTVFSQNNKWHLANDEFVRCVFMEECPLFPCVVLFAKCTRDMSTNDVSMLAQDIACDPLSWDSCIGKTSFAAREKEEHPATEDQPSGRKRKASETSSANPLLFRYFKHASGSELQSLASEDQSNAEQDRSNRKQDRSKKNRSKQKQDRSNREQERSNREQDGSNREQDRSNREQDRSKTKRDRSNIEQNQQRTSKKAQERTKQLHVDPLSLEHTPLKIFAKRYYQ